MSKRHDVIVIGSGIGGLTAALGCAVKGRDVAVLEAGKQFGGFINPFARKKFWFDAGIHYVGECGPGQSLHRHFDRLGLLDEFSFRELSPDGFDRYSFPDYEVRMCKGADAYCDRLTKDFPHEASGLRRFFAALNDVSVAVANGQRLHKVESVLRLLPTVPTLVRYRSATFSQLLEGFVTDPRLKAVLTAPSGDLGLPPGKVSGLFMMALLSHYLGGAYFPVGGQKAVRDGYVRRLKAHGATMHRNTPVEQILVEHGRVRGVRTTTGEEFFAPIVISNADAVVTLGEMLPSSSVGSSLRAKIKRTKPSLASLCVFVGTDASVDPKKHGLDDANIWSLPGYDVDALYRPPMEGRISNETPFFMTVPTLKDPTGSHAPQGKHTVELITFAPWDMFHAWKDQRTMKRDQEYVDLKNEMGRNLLSRAERYFPGLSDHIEVMEVATPLTNVSFVATPQGSIYGPEHTPAQVGLGRFGSRGPVDGLYLCGASVVGCGISPCVSSGAMAAKLALNSKPSLRNRVRRLFPTQVARRRVPAAT